MTFTTDTLIETSLLVLLILLSAAVVIDLRSRRIPNMLLLPALILAPVLATLVGGLEALLASAAGLLLGMAMLMPLYLVGGLGAGDVKLLGVVGSFLGPWGAIVAGLATMMAGAVIGLIVIMWQRLRPGIAMPAMQPPEILLARGIGQESDSNTTSINRQDGAITIPYAPAISLGTVAALWYIGDLPLLG